MCKAHLKDVPGCSPLDEPYETYCEAYAGGASKCPSSLSDAQKPVCKGFALRLYSECNGSSDAAEKALCIAVTKPLKSSCSSSPNKAICEDMVEGTEKAVLISKARGWLDSKGWDGDVVIHDPRLTHGNCHGYTFGSGGSAFNYVDTPAEALEAYEGLGSKKIMVCMVGDLVAHTATEKSGRYWQTLPDGPLFSTSASVLNSQYSNHCYELPRDKAKLAAMQAQQDVEGLFDKQRNWALDWWDGLIRAEEAEADDEYYELSNAEHDEDGAWDLVEKVRKRFGKTTERPG